MSTTQITWKIDRVDVAPQLGEHTNVVKHIGWRATATRDQYTATTYGSVTLGPPTNGFIEYTNLTETQLIDWAKSTLGTDQVAYIETELHKMIENQINPPVINPPLPWLSQTTPTIVSPIAPYISPLPSTGP